MSLDIIFGEYRDRNAVDEFVAAVRNTDFDGTLYIGYPVLAVDDDRIEFDALLVNSRYGVIVFDLYSYGEIGTGEKGGIPELVAEKQEQQYAALYNKLNSFRELRSGRSLSVPISTVSIHPISQTIDMHGDYILSSLDKIGEISGVLEFEELGEEKVRHLNAAVQRISNLTPQKNRSNVAKPDSKGAIIRKIEQQIANLDLWQKRGSIEYVNGPQRIRGLAGSGKTVVLALKAAYLHVKRPDWNIVVTFNTLSLHQQFEKLITRFVFSQIGEEPNWKKLSIIHAWGGSSRRGVYSEAAQVSSSPYRDFGTASRLFGYDTAFDGACQELLAGLPDAVDEKYDMVLVDEAQDLPSTFFQIVFKFTKSPKRIVWAYDDLQNLGDVYMPSAEELFGKDSNDRPLVQLANKPDEPQQDIVLPRCYRNPPWTLATAHSLGFGLNRHKMVQIFLDPKIWERLGYQVCEGELRFDQDVVLKRSDESVPDFFEDLLNPEESLNFCRFEDELSQYDWVAEKVKSMIDEEELDYTDFMIVIPDVRKSKTIGAKILKALRRREIIGHIPGQTTSRDRVFVDQSIAITHIHRAKGNEAPVVFVIDAQFCEGQYAMRKRRNTLFTAITRSRAWTFVCGYGEEIQKIAEEASIVSKNGFNLKFHYPTYEDAKRMAVTKERSLIEIGDEFDDVRAAIRKARETPWEQLPLDLQEDLSNLYGEEQ